jgi:hypothetical protein
MSLLSASQGRASLARHYRNLSAREIRERLEDVSLGEIERVIAKAELMRRGAGDDAPDTAFVSGFEPTSAMDIGAVESESQPPGESGSAPGARTTHRTWPLLALLGLGLAAACAWAMHARLIRL